MNKYYVYCLLDPFTVGEFVYGEYKFSNKPFYVGKGQGNRINEHYQDSILFRDSNRKKVNKIKKIRSMGREFLAIKIHNELPEDDAINKEASLISIIGIKNLTNLSPGRESFPRFKDFRPSVKRKLSESRRNVMIKNNPMKNKDVAKKVSDFKKNVKHTDEYKISMSNSLKNSLLHKIKTKSLENREYIRKTKEKYMVPVKQYDLDMNFIAYFPSIKQAGRETGIRSSDISTVINGSQKTCHGFIFKK